MSCNCPDINQCPDSNVICLCGIEINIYNASRELVETIDANIFTGEGGTYYQVTGSTAFAPVIGSGYTLTIYYNSLLSRWEMSYYNDDLELNIVLGVLYGLGRDECPISNCWDLDCISVGFNILESFDTYFTWTGEYVNGKKSYEFSSSWSGPVLDYSIYWGLAPVSAGAPAGTNCWTLFDETSGIPSGYLFNSNKCPYGVYLTGWGQAPSRFSFTDLGVTGYDLSISTLDCGCCDTEVIVTVDGTEYTATVEYDEYGNILVYDNINYYTFNIYEDKYYIFYLDGQWVVKGALSISALTFANLASTNQCPFGSYNSEAFEVFRVKGADCFDCCDYYRPGNRNLLKKKKAIFVDEISDIRNKEIFGFKCGTSWDDLFRKHLIFDVLNCLPYGVICDEEEQCLINNLNENCNC